MRQQQKFKAQTLHFDTGGASRRGLNCKSARKFRTRKSFDESAGKAINFAPLKHRFVFSIQERPNPN
jgi:hypothetical protein